MRKLTRAEIESVLRGRLDEVPTHDRDEMAIPSYLHANPMIRWLMWRRYAVIEELGGFSAGDRVLEFGCGLGLFLPTLAGAGCRVRATDLFPQFAEQLVRQLGLAVDFVPTIDSVPDGDLDFVVAADVLEHVDDLPACVRAFHRKLRPGGAVLVSGPTENFAYRFGRFLAGFGGKGDYHHTNIDAIRRVFEGNGFRTERTVCLPFALPPHLFRIFRFRAA